MATQRAALVWAGCSIAAVLYGMAMAEPSIPTEYCATVNTANMDPLNSNWQSDGRCFDNCTDLSFAFAIVQGHNCWCSNYYPNKADQKPLSDCQLSCPGFPPDYCGGDGVFGYLKAAGHRPMGTAAPGGGVPEPSSSTVPSTVTVTLPDSSSSTSSTSSSTSTDSPSPTTPIVETVTVGGTVRTVTATPKSTGTHDPALEVATQSHGLQGGAIAGIVIGVVAGLALLAFLAWIFFIKRRRRNDDLNGGLNSPMRGGGNGSPGTMATPNKMGDMSEGSMFGMGAAGAAGGAAGVQQSQTWDSAKRRSHLMPVDPRLDPFAKGIYGAGGSGAGGDPNRSRESFNSLQDNHDYSRRVHEPARVLRAMNPDPDDD